MASTAANLSKIIINQEWHTVSDTSNLYRSGWIIIKQNVTDNKQTEYIVQIYKGGFFTSVWKSNIIV